MQVVTTLKLADITSGYRTVTAMFVIVDLLTMFVQNTRYHMPRFSGSLIFAVRRKAG
jgi:hypothetical protein